MTQSPDDPFESLLPKERTWKGKLLAKYTLAAQVLMGEVNRTFITDRLFVWGSLFTLAHNRLYIAGMLGRPADLTLAVLAWIDQHDEADYAEAAKIVSEIFEEAREKVEPSGGVKKNQPDPSPDITPDGCG